MNPTSILIQSTLLLYNPYIVEKRYRTCVKLKRAVRRGLDDGDPITVYYFCKMYRSPRYASLLLSGFQEGVLMGASETRAIDLFYPHRFTALETLSCRRETLRRPGFRCCPNRVDEAEVASLTPGLDRCAG